jgi:beta-phosphoglucomutase-like phosphatase (HAD superfamily)
MSLKALIFDVDGTLAETEEAHRRAFNETFRRHGLDWNWSKPAYVRLLSITGGKERLAFYIESLPLSDAERGAMIQRIGAIHETKTEIYGSMVAAGQVPLRDGVEQLIDEAAAANVQLAIASTTTLANIEALLRATLGRHSMQRFAVVGAGDLVRHKKPAPEIYRFVLRELGHPVRECVAIEDSSCGLAAAKAAGLFTVVTPSHWTQVQDFSAADLVLPDLSTLGIREIGAQLEAVPGTPSAA